MMFWSLWQVSEEPANSYSKKYSSQKIQIFTDSK